jgi:uncharacterized membrane protein
MSTFVQWVHLTAAVVGVGGIGFLLLFLLPSARRLGVEQRDLLLKDVLGRFRWASWTVIGLLIGSGFYNVRQFYWDMRWGLAWKYLTFKIVLAFVLFAISLSITLPLKSLNWFRARRRFWLSIAFTLGLVVIYLSAYLRRG